MRHVTKKHKIMDWEIINIYMNFTVPECKSVIQKTKSKRKTNGNSRKVKLINSKVREKKVGNKAYGDWLYKLCKNVIKKPK